MDNSRNMILAFVLSALVLIGWTTLSERFFPTPKPAASATQTGIATSNTPVTAPVAQVSKKLREVAAVRAESPRVIIDTPKLSGSINLRGAQCSARAAVLARQATKRGSVPKCLAKCRRPLSVFSARSACAPWSTCLHRPSSASIAARSSGTSIHPSPT